MSERTQQPCQSRHKMQVQQSNRTKSLADRNDGALGLHDTVKTRVLFVVNTDQYGGLEKHLLDLLGRLAAPSVECTILCCGLDFYSQRLTDRTDIRVITANRNRSQTFSWYWLIFVRLKPHVIVFVKGSMDSYPLKAYIAAKLSGHKRLVAMEQLIADPVPEKLIGGGMWNWLRRFMGWRARYIARYVWGKKLAGILVDKTICISNAVRERLVDEYGFPADKAVTIPNGVDLRCFDSENGSNGAHMRSRDQGSDSDEAVILCVSRLVPRKRIDVLLDAFSLVLKDHPSCKCLIVGSGPSEEQLRRKSMELGLSASVRFAGFAEDVRPYFEKSDIYVSSSDKEGLGVSIIEAMAYRLPCVVTNIAGHNEVVSHGDNGLLVTPGSAEELAQAIKHLLVCKKERNRMGINGRKRVEELFSADNTIAKIKDVLLTRL
jgi:glycosyltransferase involved in cell wall biosynthesis